MVVACSFSLVSFSLAKPESSETGRVKKIYVSFSCILVVVIHTDCVACLSFKHSLPVSPHPGGNGQFYIKVRADPPH